MKFTLQTDNDGRFMAAYLKLREGKIVDSIELAPGVVGDFESGGVMLGVEILQPCEVELKLPTDLEDAREQLERAVKEGCSMPWMLGAIAGYLLAKERREKTGIYATEVPAEKMTGETVVIDPS